MAGGRHTAGFTIIELMVVTVIIGVLSMLAIPSFSYMVRRSKSSEATTNLKSIFVGAAAYYAKDYGDQGIGGTSQTYCTVSSAVGGSSILDENKYPFNPNPAMRALANNISGYVYFYYWAYPYPNGGSSSCNNVPNNINMYILMARADLDDDGVNQEMQLRVGSDENNELYHQSTFHSVNEAE